MKGLMVVESSLVVSKSYHLYTDAHIYIIFALDLTSRKNCFSSFLTLVMDSQHVPLHLLN